MKVSSRIAVLSGVAIVAVAGTWTALSTASRSSTAAQLHGAVTIDPNQIFTRNVFVQEEPNNTKYTVDPGDVVDAQASCPKNLGSGSTVSAWSVIGGGYHMYGFDGAAVPSATAAYPSETDEAYKVVVANPKLASGPITFYVEATCMVVHEGPLAG